MMIHGNNIIGFEELAENPKSLISHVAADNSESEFRFSPASKREVDLALEKAKKAFDSYRNVAAELKAKFLESIADEIEALGDDLLEMASRESGLPIGRFQGERGRTCGQLRLFASLLKEGSWVEASIDLADPERSPLPKADIRKMLRPIGPVVVFTASNFPLAFLTAGGDTASALAAGCPVIVKAHESHLGVNEMVAGAIKRAAEKCAMPDGVFSSLNGSGYETGSELVMHPATKAVAFTGSFRGGKSLYDLAQQRDEPIPVFAEMGSINPVVLLDDKLKNSGEEVANTYAGSIALGVGQFCTNPGLLIAKKSEALENFKMVLGEALNSIVEQCMLNKGIADNYQRLRSEMLSKDGVSLLNDNKEGLSASLAGVSATEFLKDPELQEEVFGPYSLVVECEDDAEMEAVLLSLSGQLTATIMAEEAELSTYASWIDILANKVGRVIINGAPTGVEVCYSMQHGGPFPASTDGRFTSVGTGAIKRFVRPVAYQNMPDSLLPLELQNANPMGIWRLVNTRFTNKEI